MIDFDGFSCFPMNLLVFSLEAEVHWHPETALRISRQMQEFLDHPTTPIDISTYEILPNMTTVYQHSKTMRIYSI